MGPFYWFLRNLLKCRGFVVHMENYRSGWNSLSYSSGPGLSHSRYNQGETSQLLVLLVLSASHRVVTDFGALWGPAGERQHWCLWATKSLIPLICDPLGKVGSDSPTPGNKQEQLEMANQVGLPPSLDERFQLCLQNRCWDGGIVFCCNKSRFNVCLTHLSSRKVLCLLSLSD